jgi:multimeric flavodoxin WrbA
MKIIAINSSPRRDQSNTNLLAGLALEAAKGYGAETEAIDITRLNIKYCIGCGVCWKFGKCHLSDDLQTVLDKISGADGLIFSSPVYVNNMTAQLKTLLDRMTSPLHCQFLDGKYVSSVVTTGSGDDDTVISMIEEFAIQCGATILDGVGAAFIKPGSFDEAKNLAAALGNEMASAVVEHKTFPEQEETRTMSRRRFARTVSFQKDLWEHDYQHWQDKGWLEKYA